MKIMEEENVKTLNISIVPSPWIVAKSKPKEFE